MMGVVVGRCGVQIWSHFDICSIQNAVRCWLRVGGRFSRCRSSLNRCFACFWIVGRRLETNNARPEQLEFNKNTMQTNYINEFVFGWYFLNNRENYEHINRKSMFGKLARPIEHQRFGGRCGAIIATEID